MGGTKLCLLLLLGTYTLARKYYVLIFRLMAKRFKNFRRFVYDYEAETFNGVNGATDNKSGSKVSCKVEVDVPQTCSFILRTTECALSEISGVDAEGNAVYRPAAGDAAFKAAMAMNNLKITVEGQTDVKLFPEDEESDNILNIKRGIVSALLVPVMEEERNKEMPTVHGVCSNVYTVNSREDIATDVNVTRDLSKCDRFIPRSQDTSPLAFLSGMNIPLSKMISSTQTCNYKFDNQKKHMTSGTCTEKHLFLPLSHQNEYGISTLVKQTVTLRETAKINDRIFERSELLSMDNVDEKSPVQTKDAAITKFQQLNTLSQTDQGEERASLFRKLVTDFRGLKVDVLGSAVVEMMDMSVPLTMQALVQCGTPECTSALLKVLRTFDQAALEVDATVYALALLPSPSRLMVKDMLAMAQYKKSKPIMYALSNVVRKLYQSEGVTPEITAVSEFMASLLGADCAGDKDLTFMALRVIGNMGEAMEDADAAIKNTLLKCMRQPTTTLSVQLAAIQAFRRMSVTDERVSQYPKGAVQKRLAAYLILMRNPQDSDIEMVKKLLTQEQNVQIKGFVTSHIYNIISSTDSETQILGRKLMDALQDTDVATHNDYTTKSRNYKLGVAHESMQAAIQGNIVFDPSNQLPREVLLETTLKAFGFNLDIWEVGMEGKGLEPTIEALFGKNGFFPDTVSKALYWAEDMMPPKIKEELFLKVPENLGREIVRNFNKLVKDLQSQESPEAMAYLRIMGNELGYIKGNELNFIAENVLMYADIFIRILPGMVMNKMMSGTDNEIFAHYIFMDNKFTMSTAAGLPLTFALSGTFTPGAKGGLRMSPNMKELLFMPSVGVEFMTQMGVHVPEFIASTVEMQTNIYHESKVNAKITMEQNQVKLSIPAPQGTTKLLMLIVGAGQATMIQHTEGDSNCSPLFSGVTYCTKTLRASTGDKTAAPYFPLNGETMFAVDLKPTNEVSEYTATIAYKLLSEGKDGRQKVDSLKMALRAEGVQATEATATMKYNRNRNVFTTQVQIPDFDVEAGVKVSMTDSSSKGKSMILEISNKNVPQLSLIGRANLQAMTDGMLQVQLLVPSLKTDAAITATMSKTDRFTVEIKSDVKLPETSSIQAVTFKYDQAEVQLVSNVNADTKILVPYTEALQVWLRQFGEDVMDQQVVKTDMKLRHIFNKAVEVRGCNNLNYFIISLLDVEMPTMPENLFMNLESTFRYQFNQDQMTITIPLPLGGKSSEELRVPARVTSPHISLPQVGMDISPREIQIPTFTIPSEYDLTLPLMGMVEVSAKVNSNYYNWEATVSAGNNTAESPSYLAQFNIMAESPVKLLSFSTEGTTKITDTAEKTMKFSMDGSLKHMLVNTGFNLLETIAVTDNVRSTGRYNIYAVAPLGLDTSLTITTQFTLDSNILSGDINTDGSVSVGPMTASTTYLHTFSIEPLKKEARLESTLRVNSEILKISNKVKASYANEELLIESNTNMHSNPIKHTTKMSLSYKDVKLTIQSDSVTKANERMLRSQMEFSSTNGQASLRIENQADDTENRAYSLITGSINPSGLEVNTDASMNIFSSLASHKATLALTMNGLTTSCTTTAQHSPMTFENVFHGGVDTSAELNIEGKIASTEVYCNSIFKGNLFDINTMNRMNLRVNEDGLIISNNMRNSYMHDITVNMEPYTASVIVKNDMKIMEITFMNDGQFKVEPYNMELTGTMMGGFSEEELKHTYEIKFVDMVLSAKCNTNGKLLGSHMTHTTDMEIAGLTMKFNNVANLNSPSLRLDSTVKTVAAPFTLTIDAIFNSDGAVDLYGQQSGELYSKFLLKAEPILFTHSFEYRASTTHELEGRPTIKTNMENKFNSMLSLREQSVTLKMKSKVDQHTFDEEISAYNNAEKMGIEVAGVMSTPFFSEASQDYSISGFLKYDKNSDSHFIQIPFIEHLPAVIENMKTTMMRLMDQSIEMLKDINNKYEISVKLQNKVSELKDVIDNFDFNLFVQDFRKFINSIENFMTNLTAKFPTDKIMDVLKSTKDAVMAWIKKHNIANKFNVTYAKIEEILSKYEVEKMIGALMDEIVKIMKQYQVREKIQSAFDALRSIDVQPLFKKALAPVQELVNELYSFDFKQLIEDMSNYFLKMVQNIKSFDYDTLTMELKEKITDMTKIPCFGKLYGEFRVTSPHYKLRTTADLENTTTTSVTPEFKMNLNSQATSTLKILDFTVDASAHFALPKMSSLSISENINVDQSCFTLDHKGTMTIYGLTAQASAETTAKITTELYSANLGNKALFATENGVSATMETGYNQNIYNPLLNIFSETRMNQKIVFLLEAGTARLTFNNLANGKYSVDDISNEGTHNSDMEVVMDLHTFKVTFNGETGGSNFKINQNLVADICIFRHMIIEAKVETETPFMKGSVAEVKFQAKVEDMKIDFTASHSAQLIGKVEGTLSSSALALITPNELMFDTKNKGNAKVALPFKLSGKVDLQNDIALTLNSEVQQASWTGMTRFNQYKYSHYFTMDNEEKEIHIFSQINGEANLDVLKEPITIPEMTMPFVGTKTPRVDAFSLWEDTGLSYLLTTTQQTFEMNSKLRYRKNPEVITIDINVDPIINVINTNVKTLHKKVLISKDKAAAILATSYGKAKAEYEKYSIELPKTITVPAYKVPVMNVEVSTFTIPLPDFSLITMPALHVPSALSKLTLPKITLPKIQSIKIPVMGDLIHEFSMKTAIITLKTDASILNKDNFIIQLDASSSSEFEILTGKIQGNINLNKAGGFKLSSLLSVKHSMVEGNHESAIILNYENVQASITNSAKVNLPDLTMEIYQEITGNPDEGLVVSMSTPSAGLIAVQMQTKRPVQLKTRLYGRYPSEPTTDIDILGLKMSVMSSEKLNIQTTWNMEMPYEMMLGLKKQVPTVMEMVSDPAVITYNEIYRYTGRLGDSIEQAKKQGKVVFKRAVDKLAEVNPSNVVTAVTDKTMWILKKYQKKVETILDAVVQFLRETTFQIPGYEQRMSGLEMYQTFSAFVADVSEEAVLRIPEYFASIFTSVLDYFRAIEFSLPGSNHIVSGREIIDDLSVAMRTIQDRVILTLRKLGNIQLEDIIERFSASMQFALEQSERFLQTLKSQNVEKLSAFFTDVAKINLILTDMSSEQLQVDIQFWIDSLVKRMNAFQNNAIETLKEKSKNVEPFVRVSDRQVDIDIPLPFVTKLN
uniref:Vitellogenin domain-containing protein n=1 Tax=Scophthalmus maximus TaxID=52904 RepID=A0A8D3B7A4_SCOMX